MGLNRAVLFAKGLVVYSPVDKSSEAKQGTMARRREQMQPMFWNRNLRSQFVHLCLYFQCHNVLGKARMYGGQVLHSSHVEHVP